jgi:transcriptional accessory protein Tex/SPT6
MAITAQWESTETTVRGERTEVVLPLLGLDEIHPAEDKLIAQILREAGPGAGDDDQPLWERLKLDREACRLHMFVAATPNVAQIKDVLDRALQRASEAIASNTADRDRIEAEARNHAELRERQAVNVKNAFRGD